MPSYNRKRGLVRYSDTGAGGTVIPESTLFRCDATTATDIPVQKGIVQNAVGVTAAPDAPANFSGALQVDDTEYVIFGTVPSLADGDVGDIRLSCQLKFYGTSGWQQAVLSVFSNDSATNRVALYFDGTTMFFRTGANNRFSGTPAAASSVAWREYKAERVSGVWRMYEDGVQVGGTWTESGVSWADFDIVDTGRLTSSDLRANHYIAGVKVETI
jgi:hypothetical protein